MAFCVACGAQLGEQAKFCPICGNSTQPGSALVGQGARAARSPALRLAGLAFLLIALAGVTFWLLSGRSDDPGADTDGDGFLNYEEVEAEVAGATTLQPGRWEIAAELSGFTDVNLADNERERARQRVNRRIDRLNSIDTCSDWGNLGWLAPNSNQELFRILESPRATLQSLKLRNGEFLVEILEDDGSENGSRIKRHRFEGDVSERRFRITATNVIEAVEFGSSDIKSVTDEVSITGNRVSDCY
jgi:hypothetical protein